MKRIFNKIIILLMLSMFACIQIGCEKEGTAEKAGKEVDKTYDAAKDKFKEVTK